MKKTIGPIALLFAVVLSISACSGTPITQNTATPENTTNQADSQAKVNVNSDDPDSQATNGSGENTIEMTRAMEIEYTSAFSVIYITDDIFLVTDAENQQFLLVPRGEHAPEGYDDAILIYTPVERVLFSSSTQYGMIAPFDIWDKLGGIMANATYRSPFDGLNERIDDGRVINVGSGDSTNYELVQMLDPEITFVFTGTSSGNINLIAKLDELGLLYAVDNEYMEERHKGRMEWIKFIAPFFGIADEAVEYFNEMIDRLETAEEMMANIQRPKVAWGRITNGMGSVAGADSYVAAMIESMGGEYIFNYLEGTGNISISLEDFYSACLEADIWLYMSNLNIMPSYEELLEAAPVLADLPVVANRNVWQQGLDYFSLTGEIDKQAIELAAIFHPDLFPDYGEDYRHFNKLAE